MLLHPELEHEELGLHPTAFLCTLERLQLTPSMRLGAGGRLDFTHMHTHAHLRVQISSPLIVQQGRNESSFTADEL